ncbi:MAG TPA: aldose epimerase family protein [Bauldia sp.]|nr:aldose epimerase family protein [Bauldia sp.]
MAAQRFGILANGEEVEEVTIASGDLTAKVITLGAIIRDVRLAGVPHPLVLGFDRLDDYLNHSPYFGAVVGRCANRIGHARFTLDGKTYQLTPNENGNQLHGGPNGFGRRNWRLVSSDAHSITLGLTSPDGEEGYPGTVEAFVRYTAEGEGTIKMEAEATTDAPTIVNLAQHSYFNLDGSPDILDHRVQIFAGAYTPFDADKIPTGEILSVAGTDYDLRAMRPIRLVRNGVRFVFDINYVVDRKKSGTPHRHARLMSPKSGIALDVASTEPGVQFYDGVSMNVTVPGLDGRKYPVNGGCCFEPQFFPDAINHANFPSPVLRPGQTYRQTTTFTFSRN